MQASAKLIYSLEKHTDEVARLLFAPDGRTLAASDDSTITLWDVNTGALRSKFEDLDDMFFEMAFSPDSKWIAAASFDGYGRIWNTETGELIHTLSVEDERMLSLAFSADSKLIATGSEVLRVWDVTTRELLHTLSAPGDHPLSFAAVHERNEHPAEICTVSFSLDGKWLLSGSPDTRMVCLWNTETWKLERIIRESTAFFSSDGRHLAVPTNEHKSIEIYETLTWRLQRTLEVEGQKALSSTFSPDSKTIATYAGRQIKLWCVENGEVIRDLEDPIQKISALAFSLDGKILVSGARKCGLRVWSVESGDCLLVLEPEGGARDPWNPKSIRGGPPASEVLFSDGGAKAAVAFPDVSIKIWDVRWESS